MKSFTQCCKITNTPKLNLVFHNIVFDSSYGLSKYSMSVGDYKKILETTLDYCERSDSIFKNVKVYFDDGNISTLEILSMSNLIYFCEHVVAIPTGWIGKRGFLRSTDVLEIANKGIKIVSHGVTHSALAIFRGNGTASTPCGGKYQPGNGGKKNILSENQVKYELIESKKFLESLSINPDEFVLPYGLYNNDTIKINSCTRAYKYLCTCDIGLDNGNTMRPRVIVFSGQTIHDILHDIQTGCYSKI